MAKILGVLSKSPPAAVAHWWLWPALDHTARTKSFNLGTALMSPYAWISGRRKKLSGRRASEKVEEKGGVTVAALAARTCFGQFQVAPVAGRGSTWFRSPRDGTIT